MTRVASPAWALALLLAAALCMSYLAPADAASPVLCGDGQYKSGGSCHSCQAGRYKKGSDEASSCNQCAAGKYQPHTGKSSCSNCGAGRYQGSKGQTSCHACGTGHYCPSGSSGRTQCPAGKYGSSSTNSGSGCSGNCNAGRYGGKGETSATCSGNCPAGYYCPAGSSSYSSQCAAGRYGGTGQTSSTCTGPCNAGRYGGVGQTSASCSGACSAGYYCTSGSSSSQQHACGGDQYYCSGGSRHTVSSAYYATGPSGRRTGQAKCPKGYYCNRGARHKCPAGRYGSETGLASSDCSGPCKAGYFCPEGSTSATHSLCGADKTKPRTYFCPAGTSEAILLGGDYYMGAEASRRGTEAGAVMSSNGHHGSDSSHGADQARLNTIESASGVGAWSAPSNVKDKYYLEITLPEANFVKGVATQARDSRDGDWSWRQCVTSYRVQLLNDETGKWVWADGGKVYTGNSCPSGSGTGTVKKNYLATPVKSKSVRIWPRSWTGHISMRAELIGRGENGITTPVDAAAMMKTGWAPCPPGGSCVDGEDQRVRVTFDEPNCKAFHEDDVSLEEMQGGPHNIKTYTVTSEGGTVVFSAKRVTAAAVPGVTDNCPGGELFAMSSSGVLSLKSSVSNGIDYESCAYVDVDIKVVEAENSDTCRVRVNIIDKNDPPTMPTGQVREVEETAARNDQFGAPIEASDADRDQSLLFSITGGNTGNAFKISRCSGQLAVLTPAALDFETKPYYDLTVAATDEAGSVASQTVRVNVLNANDPPIFGATTTYSTPELTVGSCSPKCMASATDPEGMGLTYSITRNDQPEAWAITSTGELVVSKADVLDFEVKTSYTLKVKAVDADGAETEEEFVITITDSNEAPVVTPETFVIDENSPDGFSVGFIEVADEDGDDLPTGQHTWSITAGNTGDAFAIDDNGELTVLTQAALNFEASPQFSLTVRASDSSKSGSATVIVFLNDVNERDTVPAKTFDVPEDMEVNAVVGQVAVNKVDVGQLYVFTAAGATDMFAVDAVSGIITLKSATLDFEDGPTSYTLAVTATDNGAPSALADTGTITINVLDVQEPPVLVSTNMAVPENSPVDTVVGTLDGRDPEGSPVTYALVDDLPPNAPRLFKVVGNKLKVRLAELNHEGTKTHDVTISLSDGQATATATVVVTVTNVEEKPVLADNPVRSIAETAPVNTVVQGGPVNAYDPESQPLEVTIQGGNTGSAFAVNEETMEVYLARSGVLNFNSKPEYNLEMRLATDSSSTGYIFFTMRILIADDNEPPVVPAGQTFTVPETAKPGDVVGTLVGNDPDVGQLLSWAVEGSSDFVVDASGKLSVSTKAALSYETTTEYEFGVRATDNGVPAPLSGSAVIIVYVEDINEEPAIEDAMLNVAEDAPAGTVLGTVVGTDPDGVAAFNVLTYAITAGGDGLFTINPSSGVVTLAKAELDFEITASYALTVRVTDPKGLSASATITVAVSNSNDRPTIQSVRFSLAENTAAGAAVGAPLRAFDQEANTQSLSYSMSGNNCWRAEVGPTDAFYFSPSEVEVPGDVSITMRVMAERYGIFALGESDSLAAPHYRVYLGQSATTKLQRCLPQADGSGNVCENVDSASTPGIQYGDGSSFVDLWLALTTTPRSGLATPAHEFSRATTTFGEDATPLRAGADGAELDDGARTMMAWVRPAKADVVPLAFGAGQSASCNLGFALLLGESTASVLGGCDDHNLANLVAGDKAAAYAAVFDGSWHHVALTYAGGAGALTLFVDGEAVGTASAPEAYATGAGFMLGSWADNSFVFEGEVRDARFYTSVVPTAEIARAVAGTDRKVTVTVGTGRDAGAGGSVLATLVDDSSLVAVPVATVVGWGTEVLSTATFTSVCYAGAPPLADDLVRLDVASGVLTSMMVPDYEVRTGYSFEVTVLDSGTPPLSDTAVVTIAITDIDEAPWFISTGDCSAIGLGYDACYSVLEIRDPSEDPDTPWVVGQILVADQEESPAELSITMTAGNVQGAFSIDPATGQIIVANPDAINFEQPPYDRFDITLKVADSSQSADGKLSIVTRDVNEPPIVAAQTRAVKELSGAGVEVGEPLVAQDVDSGEFGELTFALSGAGNELVGGGKLFAIDEETGQMTVTGDGELDYETTEEYTVTVTVTDGGGMSATADITVSILDVNERPDLGDVTVEVRENSPIGTVVGLPLEATDPDIGQFHLYTMIRNTNGDLFKLGACSGQLEVAVAALDFETRDLYDLLVTVTDDGVDPYHLSDEAAVRVIVIDVNEPPEIHDAVRRVDENTAVGVEFGEPLVGTDVDANQTLTYTLQEPRDDNGALFINPSTGVLRVARDQLDFETQPVYTVTVQVADNGVDPHPMSDTATLTVYLNDVNEPPVIPDGQVLEVPENTAVDTAATPKVQAADPDAGDSVTYSMADHPAFYMVEGGVVKVKDSSLLDHETTESFTVTVTVTDKGGNSATNDVTVLCLDVNEPPLFNDVTLEVAENSDIGTAVGAALAATDVDEGQTLSYSFATGAGHIKVQEFAFSSSEPDQLEVRLAVLDHEAKDTYSFEVRVKDSGFPQLQSAALVTVVVTDVNENPTLADVSFDIDENTQCSQASAGDPVVCPYVGAPLVGFDIDDGDVLTYAITGGDGDGVFELKGDQLVLVACADALTSGCLNHEAKDSYTVQVTVTDAGGLTGVGTVTISVNDVNEAPTISPQTRTLPEKLTLDRDPADLEVGPEVEADDVDDGDKLVYLIGPCSDSYPVQSCSLSGNDDGMFFMDPNSGQLSLADPTPSRYVPGSVIVLDVLVVDRSDGSGLTAQSTVTVTITNVNDKPLIVQDPPLVFSVAEDAGVGTVLTSQLVVSDDDVGQTHTFALVRGDPALAADLFAVDANTGAITLVDAALNHEARDAYKLYVTATDDHTEPLSGAAWVTIEVSDVNESPSVAGPVSLAVEENVADFDIQLPLVGSDPDEGDTQALEFSLLSIPPGASTAPFTIDPSTGQVRVVPEGGVDYESKKEYEFTVQVADPKTPPLTATTTVTISVLRVNEQCEVADASFTMAEGAPLGSTVGSVIATDVDRDENDRKDTLSYALNDQKYFSIDHTGKIYTIAEIDYEDRTSHTLTVTVTDNGVPQLSCVATVSVEVEDINDVTLVGFSSTGNLVDGVTAAPYGTPGGDVVYLHGTNFGPKTLASADPADRPIVVASYGRLDTEKYTDASCQVVADPNVALAQINTLIRCVTVAGTGRDLRWAVTINGGTPGVRGGAGSATSAAGTVTRYRAPSITSVDGADAIPTAGGTPLVIHGNDFGEAGTFVQVRYGPEGSGFLGVGCEVSPDHPHTQILCKSAPGVGAGLKWVVEIDGQVSSVHEGTYAYEAPALRHMTGVSQLSTMGGEEIRFNGTNFGSRSGLAAGVGVPGLSGEVQVYYENDDGYKYYMVGCSVTVAHAEITCHTAPGVGKEHRFTVVVGGQTTDPILETSSRRLAEGTFASVSYHPPEIQDIDGPGAFRAATVGGQEVVITGKHFGPVTLGAAPDSTATGDILGGYGHVASGVWTQRYAGLDCHVTSAHTQIRCKTAVGTGKDYAWRVNVGNQDSLVFTDVLAHYAPPVVINFKGVGAVDADTNGGEQVLIEGRQFGTVAANSIDKVTYGETGDEYNATCAVHVDHTALTCTTAEGAGLGLKWRVTIDGQASVTPTTEYAPPSIANIASGGDGVNVDELLSDGGQVVHISGDDFGPARTYLEATFGEGTRYLEGVTYGPSGLEYTAKDCIVVDHDDVRCTTIPGVGEDHSWQITVKDQASDLSVATTSYGRATIDSVGGLSSFTAPTNGGTRVTIFGVNFGLSDPTATVRVSFGGLTPLLVPLETEVVPLPPGFPAGMPAFHAITFRVPEGQGRNKEVVVVVTDQTGVAWPSNAVIFNYLDPVIDTVIPEAGATSSSRYLIIEGSNFGTHGTVLVTYESGGEEVTDILVPTVYTHTLIEANFNGLEGKITIQRGEETSNTMSFKQMAPSISNLCGNAGDNPQFETPGGEPLTITVNDIGKEMSAVSVSVGGANCSMVSLVPLSVGTVSLSQCSGGIEVTEDMDIAEVTCRVPEGQGIDKDVVISRLGQSSRSGVSIDYRPPTVTAVSPKLVPTTGHVWVYITGTNLGRRSVLAMLDNSATFGECEFVTNHTEVRCRAPPGEGTAKAFGPLEVYEDDISASQKWHNPGLSSGITVGYFRPTIATSPATMPTAGGALTITGTNFGRSIAQPPRVEVRTSTGAVTALCVPTTWDHFSIECELQEGDGKDLSFVVIVGGQESDPAPFRYATPVVTWFTPGNAPTNGGQHMVVYGDNFGMDPQVFLGTYSPSTLLSFNHTTAEFLIPEGAGFDLQVTVRANGQTSAHLPTLRFEYDPPMLETIAIHSLAGAILDRPSTVGGDVITLTGKSLSKFDGSVVLTGGRIHDSIRCSMHPEGSAARRQCTLYGDTRTVRSAELTSHGHNEVVFPMPEGMGTDITVHMVVGGRTSIESPRLEVSYSPPDVDRVSPDVSHARGDVVQFIGDDFGEDADPRNQNITVFVGGEPCADVTFHPRKTTASYSRNPYLSCRTPNMVVGWKEFVVHAALQSDEVLGACNGTAKCERMRTECEVGSYGQEGEWCLSCPRGATCGGSTAEPIAKKEWWLQNGTMEDDCPAAGSPEAAELDGFLAALDRFHKGGPLEWRDVDSDTGLLVRYSTVEDFCISAPRVCSITHCKRLYTAERSQAPMAVPCDPKWACTGNNTCSVGYDGWRCSECDKCFKVNPEDKCRRYYKRAGECVECPDNPWILAVGFLTAVIAACIAGYIVNKKHLHLAFLSIGVDYFQILAIFANSRVQWPPLVKEIFHMMSVFNFNLEITAPECSIPDLGYYTKWMFIEALPLAAIIMFSVGHVVLFCYKKFILCRSGKTTGHVNMMIGSLFLLLYYLYLYITRTTLDVFNCAPTDPYDGYTYLSVVFERCWEPGGIHLRLLPFAICTLVAYTLMYPAVVGVILRRYRFLIMEDQLLLAQNKGETRLTNPHAYHVRKRYHKLYYHFRPDYYYWILVVIARKFLIAFTALMFTKNPAFQLSISLLIVFTSYVLQVKNRPYMSMSERDDVLADHERRAREEGPGSTHALLAQNLGNIQSRGKKATRTVFGRSTRQEKARRAAEQAASFFFNYNTVEAVLLCCAVLVNLSGIMFESGQFDSEYYQEQRNMVSYFVLTVIFTSITYFCIVLYSEVRATLCPQCCSRNSKKRRGSLKRASSGSRRGSISGTNPLKGVASDVIQLSSIGANGAVSNNCANPMFGQQGKELVAINQQAKAGDSEEVTILRGALRRQTDEVERLQAELRQLKLAEQQSQLAGPSEGRPVRVASGASARKHKREFRGVRVTSNPAAALREIDTKIDPESAASPSRPARRSGRREFGAAPAGSARGRGRSGRRRLPSTRRGSSRSIGQD